MNKLSQENQHQRDVPEEMEIDNVLMDNPTNKNDLIVENDIPEYSVSSDEELSEQNNTSDIEYSVSSDEESPKHNNLNLVNYARELDR